MTADSPEHRILVGNRFLDARFLQYIPFDDGEADMRSWHRGRVAREGCDGVSLIQGLFHQASTSAPGGSKDHDMHDFLPPCSPWDGAPQAETVPSLERSVCCCSHHARRVVVGAPRT